MRRERLPQIERALKKSQIGHATRLRANQDCRVLLFDARVGTRVRLIIDLIDKVKNKGVVYDKEADMCLEEELLRGVGNFVKRVYPGLVKE